MVIAAFAGQCPGRLSSKASSCPAECPAVSFGHSSLCWTVPRKTVQRTGGWKGRRADGWTGRRADGWVSGWTGRGGRVSGRRAKGERKETLALYSSSCPKRCATWTFKASGNHSRPHPIECAPIFFSCTSDGWTVPGHCPARRPAAQLRVCVFASLRKALARQSPNAIKNTR